MIPPPATPVDAGPPEKRNAVEEALGLTLPDDMFDIAMAYGSGEFRTNEYSLVLSIENPFSPSFISSAKKAKKQLKGLWKDYDVYPDTPGLFPCGTGEGPRDLYFYTDGPPNRWPLLVGFSASPLVKMKRTLSEYVFRLLDGSLEGQVGEIENQWFGQLRGKFWFQPFV